jgi:hypothetical protein
VPVRQTPAVLLTLSTTRVPATDLGFLLHKNPARAQQVELPTGTAHVFYPDASDERCTVALLLEVDPAALRRTKGVESGTLGTVHSTRVFTTASTDAVGRPVASAPTARISRSIVSRASRRW